MHICKDNLIYLLKILNCYTLLSSALCFSSIQ